VDENAEGVGLNALRMREADLEHHLANDGGAQPTAAARDDALEEQARIIAAERLRKPLEYGSGDDFQLAQALKHLKGQPLQLSRRAGATLAQHAR
jgi:carboxyl-terminal processing protease